MQFVSSPRFNTKHIKSHSTGSLSLDLALGTQGFTYGRMVEISGETGVGKTTLALNCLAACQQNGGNVAYLDPEFALNREYARAVGIDVRKLVYSQPRTAEQAFEIAISLISSDAIDVLVIDSIAALLPKQHAQQPIGITCETELAHSKALVKGLSALRLALKGKSSTVIFTNQLRQKYENASGRFFPESQGGRPVYNFMATRIRMHYGHMIKNGDSVIGHHCLMNVLKHKDGKTVGKASSPVIYDRGIASSYETLTAALNAGVVVRTADGLFANGSRLGRNGAAAKNFLDKMPAIRFMLNRNLLMRNFIIS